jgi:Amt family ammonium transporter
VCTFGFKFTEPQDRKWSVEMAKQSCVALLLLLSFTTTASASAGELVALQKELHELRLLAKTAIADRAALHEQVQELRETMAFNKENAEDSEKVSTRSLAEKGGPEDWQAPLTHVWLLICGSLVMFMQAGFALVESGSCRSRNVQNILMKNMCDVCVGTLSWWAVGWSLAYGFGDDNNSGFAGNTQFFADGFLKYEEDTGAWKQGNSCSDCELNWFFQWAFCSAAATIVSGGVAERVQFPAYATYTLCMTAFIYPIVVGWTWSGSGWLNAKDPSNPDRPGINDIGIMDFAGSGIVHMTGGFGALVGAVIAGPRLGRFDGTAIESEFDPHSLPLIVQGTFVLWFGWYGFNCGSTLSMGDASTGMLAAHVALTTTLSAATGGLTVLAIRFAILKRYDIGGMCNGVLAGLVSITAGCATVEPHTALLIGFLGACLYEGASRLLKFLKVDDPIDAFAVHGSAGAWGALACAFFDWGKDMDYAHGWSGFSCYKDGDISDPDKCKSGAWGEQMVANIVMVLAVIGWTVGLSTVVFLPLRLVGVLRSPDIIQDQGQDAAKHSPTKAYSIGDSSTV